MHNTFRSFAELLAAPPAAEPAPEPPAESPCAPEVCTCAHEAIADLRLFKARVRAAVDDAVHTIAGDIAAVVLARELELRPAATARIVNRACERFFSDDPVRVRVSASDARELAPGLPVVIDEQLRPGDVLLEVRTGSVDASLGARFASMLENAG